MVGRQERAWRLFVAGATFAQVGEQLGVSGKTAWYDVNAARKRLLQCGLLDADLIRSRQQAGLDAIRLAHYPKRGDKTSADVLLRVWEREARLNGLDVKPTDAVPLDQVVGFIREVTALFLEVVGDDALRRQFAAGLKRQIGSLAGRVIDMATAPPKKDDDESEGGSNAGGASAP